VAEEKRMAAGADVALAITGGRYSSNFSCQIAFAHDSVHFPFLIVKRVENQKNKYK
jgi:hypothetical protein